MAQIILVQSHHHHQWLINIVVRFIKNAEDDAATQIRIHKIFTVFWIVNFFAVLLVYSFLPDFWQKASVLYLVLVSLYANFATDYGALTASQGALSALHAAEKLTKEE